MKKERKETVISIKQVIVLIAMAVISGGLLTVFPDRLEPFADASWRFLYEMIVILPALAVLIGLFKVFIPGGFIEKHLGRASGVKGFILSVVLGALPTGPLYVAFPIAAALLAKGAGPSNVIVFLTAWACIKIPQEIVELSFLGPAFTALRLVLTLVAAALMGYITEGLMDAKLGKRS